MNYLQTKILLFAGALLALFFFSSDFSLIDIEKTAIIVSIGIDKADEGYEVTAQIAIPQATDTASANNDAVISGKGKTIFEAIDSIALKTGWSPKLSFCNLILINKELAEENMLNIVDFFVSSSKVENSALIALSDGSAKELLLSSTPLDAISSFALQKVLMKNTWKVNSVSVTNLRSFKMRHYSPSKCGFMPIIKSEKSDNKGKEGGSSAVTASTSDSGGGGSDKADIVFDATKTAVFSDGKLVLELEKEESQIFNLLTRPTDEAYTTIKADDEELLFSISKNDHNISIEFNQKPTIKLSLAVTVSIVDSDKQMPLKKLNRLSVVEPKYLEAIKQDYEQRIEKMCAKLKEKDADLFGAKELIYKYHYKRFKDLKKMPLSLYDVETNINVFSED